MARDHEDEKVVSVSTKEECGGYTATVVTDAGNVYTGRSHPLDSMFSDASEDKAIRNAVNKVGR